MPHPVDKGLTPVHFSAKLEPFFAILVGRANGDSDLLQSIDGRSHKLQCRSASRTREADECIGEGPLTERS